MSSLMTTSPVDEAGESGWLLLTALALVAVALGSLTVVRFVPTNKRLLVSRYGRRPRVAGPGMTTQIPLVDRTLMVSLEPTEVEVVARAVGRDGVDLVAILTVELAIVDPSLVVDFDDPLEQAATAVEEAVSSALSSATMTELGAMRDDLETELVTRANATTRRWGVEVLSTLVQEIDARVVVPPGLDPH